MRAKPETIKYIIDAGVDLESTNHQGWKPIHYVCKYSTQRMIKYIIDKGVDLECVTNDGAQPIYLILHYSTPKMVTYIKKKNKKISQSQK